MKFVLDQLTKCSGRLGLLTNIERLPDKSFNTPLLLYLNPQLSREVLELSGFDLSNFAICLPIQNVEQMEKPVSAFKKGISKFVGLEECLTFISVRDSSEFASGNNDRGSVPIFKKAGKVNITAERYMNMMETFKPDFFCTLADGDTWKDAPKKRVIKSVERSKEFLEICIQRLKKDDTKISQNMVITLTGGYSEWERNSMLEEIKSLQDISGGYLIDGLHRNGHDATKIDFQSLKDIVTHSLQAVPTEKLKIMMGAYNPITVLELISLGIDIFDSSFINLVTNTNRALIFNFDLSNPIKRCPEIDLMDIVYKEDFRPFVEGCECLACRQNTRAYCNHLLNTHELLGPMLLTIHNLFHYRQFFESVRVAIKDDRLPEMKKLIADQYESNELLNYEPLTENGKQKFISETA